MVTKAKPRPSNSSVISRVDSGQSWTGRTSVAPSSPKRRAMARPIGREAPGMRAILPCNLMVFPFPAGVRPGIFS